MAIKRIFFISLIMLLSLPAAHAAGTDNGNLPSWKGRWITTDRAQGTPNTWLIYRKEANLDEVPETLNARIAADSKYWMWINDSLVVFEGGLKRGPAPGQTYYDVVDIAPYLVPGENTIAVLLWYFGKNGFSHASSGAAALLFDAQSPEAEIVSDNTWLCGCSA